MAKRRKVAAPSADDLNRLEEEFRRETHNRPNAAVAPISQVAADAAQAQPIENPTLRAEQARDHADAEAMRLAEADGRMMINIPIDQIMEDAMVRDRTVLLVSDMQELKTSIAAHGLRLPVEVFDQAQTPAGTRRNDKPYGLLSGYRRLQAIRELYALTGDEKYTTIKALVREPDALGGAFAAMVEENEIRASLSHYERGRIAVIAAQQGVFASIEDAVSALFSAASKAKRSKIRSFAVIFEELGDLLEFPHLLREKDGLRIATALRNGADSALRDALADAKGVNPEEEWALLEPVIAALEETMTPGTRGGRPKRAAPVKSDWSGPDTMRLASGVTLRREQDSDGHLIRIKGRAVDAGLVDEAMRYLADLFDKP